MVATGVVVAFTLLCFLPSLRNGLLGWDDAGYILDNVLIRSLSLDTVRSAFFGFHCNYWAPLTWLSLAVDYAMWGADPFGYHLTNDILHALNAGLFFLVAVRLLAEHRSRSVREDGSPGWTADRALAAAFLAAILSAIHPLRVESVAWATERKDVLSLFFGLAALLAYLEHTRCSEGRAQPAGDDVVVAAVPPYRISLALYALSLCSKSSLVTLPAVLLVLDWFPLRRFRASTWKRLLVEKAPYLLLAALAAALTASAHTDQLNASAQVDPTTRVLLSFRALTAYLRLTAVPLDVSPVYLHPGNIPEVTALHLVPVVAVLAVTTCCAAFARRQPLLVAAWAIFLVTLAPFLGFLEIGPQWMAGRFTYVPAMAIAMVVSAGVVTFQQKAGRFRAGSRLVAAAATAIVVGNAWITVRDISWWKDDETLWTRSIELNPGVGRQYFNRGLARQERREHRGALSDFDEAYAIAMRKGYKGAHEIIAARARVLRDMGDLDGAIAEFGRAIGESPPDAGAMYRWERGVVHQTKGDAALAAEDFRRSSMPE